MGTRRCDAARSAAPAMLALVVIVLLIAACGFQLRGAAQVDPAMSPMGVEGVHRGSPLLPALRVALGDAGVEVLPAGSRVHTLLRIVEDETGERIIAVTPEGRPREMELFHRVTFELHDADGELLPRRTVILTRDFGVDERDVLGRAQEAEVLRQALQRDIVNAVVRQVAAVRSR